MLIGNFQISESKIKELKETKGDDTFLPSHGSKNIPLPPLLLEEISKRGYDIMHHTAIGGSMQNGVYPHTDDIEPEWSMSLIWFPVTPSRSNASLCFFYEGKWHNNVKSGDAFIVDTDKEHAVLLTSNHQWVYYSVFLEEK